ncbi:MAG: hypothetical protein GX378_09100 [Bacteroidales bacterium]|nr:hypothetical protein [Bacteroidales bacterium]
MKTKIFLVFITVFSVFTINAQISDSSINMLKFSINYSAHLPGGDMAQRFGMSSMIGGSLEYKIASNWGFGLEFAYIFGGKVKDTTIFNNIATETGYIINKYGEYATFTLSERGMYAGANLSKLIPVFGPNKNSGILVSLGAGLLQHHIHIENKDNNAPQILGDYKKGYDRLSNGLAVKEFIGYQHLDNKRLINFYIGFEFYQAFTMSRRDYDFNLMRYDDTKRKDFLSGIRFGWIIPFYTKSPEKYYFY